MSKVSKAKTKVKRYSKYSEWICPHCNETMRARSKGAHLRQIHELRMIDVSSDDYFVFGKQKSKRSLPKIDYLKCHGCGREHKVIIDKFGGKSVYSVKIIEGVYVSFCKPCVESGKWKTFF